MAGRTPDKTPNKVMTSVRSESNTDGSRTLTVVFNNDKGERSEQNVTLAVKDNAIVLVDTVVDTVSA